MTDQPEYLERYFSLPQPVRVSLLTTQSVPPANVKTAVDLLGEDVLSSVRATWVGTERIEPEALSVSLTDSPLAALLIWVDAVLCQWWQELAKEDRAAFAAVDGDDWPAGLKMKLPSHSEVFHASLPLLARDVPDFDAVGIDRFVPDYLTTH